MQGTSYVDSAMLSQENLNVQQVKALAASASELRAPADFLARETGIGKVVGLLSGHLPVKPPPLPHSGFSTCFDMSINLST